MPKIKAIKNELHGKGSEEIFYLRAVLYSVFILLLISYHINNKIKMSSGRKQKSVERPCSAGALGQDNPFNTGENPIFMGLDYDEVKNCVVVLLEVILLFT